MNSAWTDVSVVWQNLWTVIRFYSTPIAIYIYVAFPIVVVVCGPFGLLSCCVQCVWPLESRLSTGYDVRILLKNGRRTRKAIFVTATPCIIVCKTGRGVMWSSVPPAFGYNQITVLSLTAERLPLTWFCAQGTQKDVQRPCTCQMQYTNFQVAIDQEAASE